MAENFLKQLAGAAVVMGGLCAALVWVGRSAPEEAAPLPFSAPRFEKAPRGALALLPARAWLVAEFESSLVNARPFAGEAAPCDRVKAPARVAFAIAPSARAGSADLSFFLASTGASVDFARCTEQKILSSGGQRLPGPAGLVVLKSPSGLFVRQGANVVFSTTRADGPELEALLAGRGDAAAFEGPHAVALGGGEEHASSLRLSLELPPDWLTHLDPAFARSPLVALRGASLSLTPEGGAQGVVRCEDSGCAALQRFAAGALSDLTSQAPPSVALELRAALRFSPPDAERPGEFRLEISPTGVDVARGLLSSWSQSGPLPGQDLNP